MAFLRHFCQEMCILKEKQGAPIKRGVPTQLGNAVVYESNRMRLEQLTQYDHTTH